MGAGSGCCPAAFALCRCPIPHRGRVSSPPPVKPDMRFSRIRLSDGSCPPPRKALRHWRKARQAVGSPQPLIRVARVPPFPGPGFRQSHCRSRLPVCAAVAGWAGLTCPRCQWFAQPDSIRFRCPTISPGVAPPPPVPPGGPLAGLAADAPAARLARTGADIGSPRPGDGCVPRGIPGTPGPLRDAACILFSPH